MAPFLVSDLAIESRIRLLGMQLFASMEAQPQSSLLSKKGAYARLMEWSMKDPAFKTQLFRFVDVLPALTSSAEIIGHLQEYLGDKAVELHPALKVGLSAAKFAPGLVASPVKAQVVDMARQFVAGETPDDLVKRLTANASNGLATTIDLLGETVVSEAEADAFLQRNLELLDAVAKALPRLPAPSASDITAAGVLPRINLSVKISALTPDVHPADPENSIRALKQRLRPILRRAAEVGAFINFDMESYKLKDLTLALFTSILEEPEFARPRLTENSAAPYAPAVFGIALQAYLREAERDLVRLIAWARERRQAIAVRLVKGAYWDYETILARQRDWPVPVWSRKAESDANYEKLTLLLLENADLITPAFATHNVRSVSHAIAQAERLRVDPRTYEFQALYGMADELKAALVQSRYRVREYCPVGELLPGMAYLVRRLLENTSNEGFLRARNAGQVSPAELLRNPVEILISGATSRPIPVPAPVFRNAANTDFTHTEPREKLRRALNAARSAPLPESKPQPGTKQPFFKIGQQWPLVIGGKRGASSNGEYVASRNPAHPSETLGFWSKATIDDANAAVAAARSAFPAWRATSVEERAQVLEKTATLMEAHRFDLAAIEILEAAKPWVEADVDVSEAIDFCRYYAVEMRHLAEPQITQSTPGELNVQTFTPRGIGVAISPWNFPLAILCGLTVAPLVAGNTMIVKPAEQTSLIAAVFVDLLIQAGAPPGTVNLITGLGEDVGAHLVAHPQIDFVGFTGSRAVGLKILETAGRTSPGQANVKKVVCEMGGKNALIIDNDADLDEAIPAALYSAFGFSGQKCSALSRLIVLEGVYDRFVERFTAAAASIPVGDPVAPGTVVGPVIDTDARAKILRIIDQGKREAKLVYQSPLPESSNAGDSGHFVPVSVFIDVSPQSVLAREEIFGPVVAIIRAKNLDEAFAIANDSEYALTGGLFSRSPRVLERARQELAVGNLYLNRGITGAIVERHPFGGFKMSGGGTKAGGKGYLENFLFARVVSENVMRRGFTPPGE